MICRRLLPNSVRSFSGEYGTHDKNGLVWCNCKDCTAAAREGFFRHIANMPDTPAHIRDMVKEYTEVQGEKKP